MDDLSDNDTKKLNSLFESCGLYQHITEPTHKDGHTIDLLVTRQSETNLCSNIVVDHLISDHFTVLFQLDIPKPPHVIRKVEYRKIKSIDMDKLKSDLANSDLCRNPSHDLDSLVLTYKQTLESLLDSHAPLRSTNMTIRPLVPWITDDIKEAKRTRRKLERKMNKSDLENDKKAFKSQRNSVVYMLFSAQKDYYTGLIEESGGNQKSLFKVTNSLLGKNQETPLPPHETVTCLVNEFNDFFIRKIDTLRDKLDSTQSDGNDFSSEDHGINFTPLSTFKPVSEDEVRKIITNSPSKSCMLDPLPTQVFKQCIDLLLPILTIMINLSLQLGYFPAEWKEAIIIPLIKKLGLETIFKSYRPVSNLLYVSKLCERVVAKQYCGHLTSNKLYSKFQSAYREGHSTETALLCVQNDILMSMDKGEVTLLLLLDLSAAFDTLDHGILLKRLESRFGINGVALQWIKSYLTGRQQSVVINGVRSDDQALKYGVPQGSVLGPLLFTAYTAPLEDIADRHS